MLLQHKVEIKIEIVELPDSTSDKLIGIKFLKRTKIPYFVDLATVKLTKPLRGNDLPSCKT